MLETEYDVCWCLLMFTYLLLCEVAVNRLGGGTGQEYKVSPARLLQFAY